MGCLLDGFKWSKWLKRLGPTLLALYFSNSFQHWHFLDDDTMLKIKLWGYEKDFVLTTVAETAALNAALFFWAQAINAYRYDDRTTVLSTTLTINWKK